MRVYELAKELGKQAKVLLEELRELGFEVTAPTSGLSEDEVEQIRRAYAGLGDAPVDLDVEAGPALDETVAPVQEAPVVQAVLPFGGFVLVRKATVSAGGVVVKKGGRISETVFHQLPARVHPFFDKG